MNSAVAQIFLNLLENAIKYNTPGGRVTVSAREDDFFVDVEVADTGIGIVEETCREFLSGSTAWIKLIPDRPAGQAWGSPSSSTSSRPIRVTSPSPANRDTVRPSGLRFLKSLFRIVKRTT